MFNRKAYLVHFLAMLILSVSYFVGSSLAAPTFQRRDDGDGSLPSSDPTPTTLLDAADSFQKVVDDATLTMTPVITPTPTVQGSPDDGTTTTTPTVTSTPIPSAVLGGVTPTPTVELVPPVTVLKQLGTTAVVAASKGTTTTIQIPAAGASGVPSPSNLVKAGSTSDGVVLTISSSMIAAGLAIAAWIVL